LDAYVLDHIRSDDTEVDWFELASGDPTDALKDAGHAHA
jgi:hypothetical protein